MYYHDGLQGDLDNFCQEEVDDFHRTCEGTITLNRVHYHVRCVRCYRVTHDSWHNSGWYPYLA